MLQTRTTVIRMLTARTARVRTHARVELGILEMEASAVVFAIHDEIFLPSYLPYAIFDNLRLRQLENIHALLITKMKCICGFLCCFVYRHKRVFNERPQL